MKKQHLNHLFSLLGILLLVNLAFMPLQALGEEGKKITSITVSGNEAIQTVEIMAHITSQVGEILDENKVRDDLQSIYKTGSFYDVSTQFKENKKGVDVNFAVIENPVVKEIVIEGNTKFTDEELRKLVRSKEGEMLNSVVLEQDLVNLQKKYHDAGYVMAKVDNLGFAVDNKLTIQIFEGNIIEAITAVGNKKTRESVITRNFSKNIIDQPFNVKLVQRGMQNVYNTGFFEDVNMTLEDGSAPDRKKLVVNVKEGKTAVGTIGGGYSSDDGMTGIIQLTEKNFRGNGSQVGIRWEFGGANEYSLSYSNPWIDDKHTSFGISIYDEEHDKEKDIFNTEHDYEEKVKGISVVVGRPIGNFSRASLRLTHKNSEADWESATNGGTREQFYKYYDGGNINSATIAFTRDTRDDVMNPRHGHYNELRSQSGGYILGGDYDYTKFETDLRKYIPVSKKDSLAIRLFGGTAFGDVPDVELFEIGGADTLRGYDDDQFEGKKAATLSVEYRKTFNKRFQGVVFADAGGVWESEIGEITDGIKTSVGVGVRVVTPLGPLRLDYAVGEEDNKVHFSFGHTF